jgi:hypothetical protein
MSQGILNRVDVMLCVIKRHLKPGEDKKYLNGCIGVKMSQGRIVTADGLLGGRIVWIKMSSFARDGKSAFGYPISIRHPGSWRDISFQMRIFRTCLCTDGKRVKGEMAPSSTLNQLRSFVGC